MYLYSYIASPVRFIGLFFFSKFLLPEDQKGDVVAEATDKKEAEEEDIDAPRMPIVEAAASNDFPLISCEASGFLNPNVESSA